MQPFLFSVIAITIISWVILLTYAARITEANLLADLLFVTLLFAVSVFTLSLIFYFGRLLISKLASRGKIRFDNETFVNLRPVYRRSFKMAAVVSVFIAILAFLKLEELLNLFNLALLLAIVVLGAVWLRR